MKKQLTVFVLSLSSDIGRELGKRFDSEGWRVCGTYRKKEITKEFPPHWQTIQADLSKKNYFQKIKKHLILKKIKWDLWISAVGKLEPVGPFFKTSFKKWAESLKINCIEPLRVLHNCWSLRAKNNPVGVCFFAGPGTNGPAPCYSAYCLSKILLIKITELLDSENQEANFFAIGPGIVNTKIHKQTIRAKKSAGNNYKRVLKILSTPDRLVSHNEVYQCVKWCFYSGKKVGGRNISLVSDSWRSGGNKLLKLLQKDVNFYKLRRCGNNQKIK